MKSQRRFRKIFKWIFRGGLIGMPLVFTSTLALSERLTWAGAILLWFYTGRILRQREKGDSKSATENK